MIRPSYCPLCLWNADLPAEERLNHWLKGGNLRQHIEEQHICRLQWPTTKPVCGCAQAFNNERDLRHHLHDIHGLNKAIWSSPKHPRKRKHTCKVELETQRSSTEPEEKRLKRFRFRPYPPPHHKQQSDHVFISVPALLSYVEEHPERYYRSKLSDTPNKSSRNSSTASYFSAADSSLSSPPTTTGLDVIDPRILKLIGLYIGDVCQPYNQAPVQLDSPDLSMHEPWSWRQRTNHSITLSRLNDLAKIVPATKQMKGQARLCEQILSSPPAIKGRSLGASSSIIRRQNPTTKPFLVIKPVSRSPEPSQDHAK